eukprot:9135894-Alexandrium_andersonii.AAC.1
MTGAGCQCLGGVADVASGRAGKAHGLRLGRRLRGASARLRAECSPRGSATASRRSSAMPSRRRLPGA